MQAPKRQDEVFTFLKNYTENVIPGDQVTYYIF